MYNLFKIVNNGASLEEAPASIVTPTIRIDNPSEAVYHKFGYWPKEEVEPVKPDEEEGYVVYDDGYKYIDDGNGGKIIKRIYRKLKIVDPGAPEIGPNQELYRDYWKETDTERIHVYVVLTIIDIKPTIDEEVQIIINLDDPPEWDINEEAGTKTRIYKVRTKVDNPPVLEPGQQIISDRWEDDGEFYRHVYEVRFIVDNPPVLEPGQQVVEDHWEDDGVTRTHIYDKIMFVVDNPPELQPGQQIIDRYFTDDEETNTRTWHYEVRFVVDNPPELAENEYIFEDHWEDDGTTRTHVYVTHFRIDNPPVLEPGQEIIEEHWEYDEATRTETHVYTVRFVVDNPPELAEDEFIYEDHWDDDGTTRTHVYDVWKMVDVAPDPVEGKRVCPTDRWEDIPETKQRKRIYVLKTIIDEKPADDPDGDFWFVFDHEEETEDSIIFVYRKVFKEWRIFSKLKLEIVAFKMGLLSKLDEFLESEKLKNDLDQEVSLRRFYDQANELGEKHPLFKPYYHKALEALGLTEEQGEALLVQIVAEPTPTTSAV